jgi:hypothetical protein
LAIPNDCEKGDLLICVLRAAGPASTWSWPGGWNEMVDAATDGSDDDTSAAYHFVDNTENGYVVPTHASGNIRGASVCFQYRGASTPVSSGVTAATTTTPNPPNCNPAAGTKNYKWLAIGTWEESRPTTPPTNYTEDGDIVGTAGESLVGTTTTVTISWGHRDLNASQEDPGAFGAITSSFTMCYTIAIPPL